MSGQRQNGHAKSPLLRRDVLHALTMRHIDEVERGSCDEILCPRLAADIGIEALLQLMPLRIVEP